MAIVPQDLLESAKRLAALSNEADTRSAVSRSYYCSYHEASAVAETLPDHHNMANIKGGMHERLAKKLAEFPLKMIGFTEDQSRIIRSVGVMLNQLKTQRRQADYELNDEIPPTNGAASCEASEKISVKLQQITGGRVAITA